MNSVESTLNTAYNGAKSSFTKGTVALAGIGIVLDTYDDVVQLQEVGADDATIKAAVVTVVGFGIANSGISMAAAGGVGALAGSLVCPVVGTAVGVVVGVLGSMGLDRLFSKPKRIIRDKLAKIFKK